MAELARQYTKATLISRIVEPTGLRLLQPLDQDISAESWRYVTSTAPDGSPMPTRSSVYPMILMRARRSVYASVCLVLEKPVRA